MTKSVKKGDDVTLQEKDHFEIIGDKNRRFLMPNGRLIDLRFGVPKDALSLYLSGSFKHIGLKKGAEVLFKGLTKEKVEKLIAQAPRPADVAILKKVLS